MSEFRSRAAGRRGGRRSVWLAASLAAVVPMLHGVAGGQEAPPAEAPSPPVDSLAIIERAVAADSSFENLYRLGIAYLDRDRAFEAVQIFEKCTHREPENVKAWVNLGAAHDAMGHGPQARVAYRQALEMKRNDEIALCRLSASLYASNQRGDAMDTLRLALQEHPESYCAYFTLGVAFADAQMFREAVRAWEKVTQYGKGTPEAQAAEESINSLLQILGEDTGGGHEGHGH